MTHTTENRCRIAAAWLVACGLAGVTDATASEYVFAGSYYSSGSLVCDLARAAEPPPYGPGAPSVLPPTIYPTSRPAFVNDYPGFSIRGAFRINRVTIQTGQSRDTTFLGSGSVKFEDF
ncbi:MAG: hypothetical protein AAGJ97_05540 [Planctomycetota bacterium]